MTKRERAAIRAALATYIADEHDTEEFDEFDLDDAISALGKMQEPPLRARPVPLRVPVVTS